MIHLYLHNDPLRIEDEEGNSVDLSGKTPKQIAEYINSHFNVLVHCQDAILAKKVADLIGVVGVKKEAVDLDKLPEDYIYPFGSNKGKRLEEVPDSYRTWWEREIPKNRWFPRTGKAA